MFNLFAWSEIRISIITAESVGWQSAAIDQIRSNCFILSDSSSIITKLDLGCCSLKRNYTFNPSSSYSFFSRISLNFQLCFKQFFGNPNWEPYASLWHVTLIQHPKRQMVANKKRRLVQIESNADLILIKGGLIIIRLFLAQEALVANEKHWLIPHEMSKFYLFI